MKLCELIKELEIKEEVRYDGDAEISDIVYDTRRIVPGCIFVCIEGTRFDSHTLSLKAEEAGAAVIIASKPVEALSCQVIYVPDTRKAMALLSAAFFGHPARELKTVAITGTKGKTTTSYMVKELLERAGHKCGLIGTIEIDTGKRRFLADHSTPESYLIHEYMREMVDAGCDAVVMEASSQGFKMDRTWGIEFDTGVFTNLEKDHISPEEHASMEEYIACKAMLFRQCRRGLFNMDDSHVSSMTAGCSCSVSTFGLEEGADLRATDIELINRGGYLGIACRLKGSYDTELEIGIPGRFNVYNALCAAAIAREFDVPAEILREVMKDFHVHGRVEPVKVSDKYSMMIDYAHNSMALESLLKTLREYEPGRLVCIFGCGGNRSRDRRFEMGEVSGRLADLTIITSDNPRYEKPEDIIADIITGIEKTGGSYTVVPDREEAVKYALENAREGDLIVLAGKGHENYQEICGVKHHMDERELIMRALKETSRQK